MVRSLINDLRRGTAALVIDHFTVHFAANTASVHILEKDAEGKTIHGQDIGGVTVEDLGTTGEIATAISGSKLCSAISSAAGGLPVTLEQAPPKPNAEPKADAAVAADSAP